MHQIPPPFPDPRQWHRLPANSSGKWMQPVELRLSKSNPISSNNNNINENKNVGEKTSFSCSLPFSISPKNALDNIIKSVTYGSLHNDIGRVILERSRVNRHFKQSDQSNYTKQNNYGEMLDTSTLIHRPASGSVVNSPNSDITYSLGFNEGHSDAFSLIPYENNKDIHDSTSKSSVSEVKCENEREFNYNNADNEEEVEDVLEFNSIWAARFAKTLERMKQKRIAAKKGYKANKKSPKSFL
jgi:hypothetical protein